MRFRFSKDARLLKHADFDRVYQEGRRVALADLALFYAPRVTGEGVRVGFAVGRALGGAVQRNRLKRRLREAVRLSFSIARSAAFDAVIHPRASCAELNFAELAQEVREALMAAAEGRGRPRRSLGKHALTKPRPTAARHEGPAPSPSAERAGRKA